MSGTRLGLSGRARHLLQPGVAALALVLAASAVAAPVIEIGALSRARTGVLDTVQQIRQGAQPQVNVQRLVWDGADIDGDGQPDFANPTGKGERGVDAYGEGRFGASRDGGVRRHEGADFMADPGQAVTAPISGFVTKIGYAYAGDQNLKFVEITNPALSYVARVFYVDPTVAEGDTVAIGNPIGRTHSLQRKYPGGMTDHVHLEIIDTSGARIDPKMVLMERLERVRG